MTAFQQGHHSLQGPVTNDEVTHFVSVSHYAEGEDFAQVPTGSVSSGHVPRVTSLLRENKRYSSHAFNDASMLVANGPEGMSRLVDPR